MLTDRVRDLTITLAALAAFNAAPAKACTIVLGPKDERRSERAAFSKADLVVTVDALSESYIPLPGAFAGTLRVGVGTGRVLEVHRGHRSFERSFGVSSRA